MNDNVVQFPKQPKQPEYTKCPCPCEPVEMSREVYLQLMDDAFDLKLIKEYSLYERIFCWPYKK